jgi:hypothetical protein
MTDFVHPGNPRRPTAVVAIFIAVILALLIVPTALIALAFGFGLLPLPYELFLVLQRRPLAFPLHMIASALALILIPIAAFARHRRVLHRAVGRTAATCVAVGGATALMVALASEAGGATRAGFFTQGLVWLALVSLAVGAIRRGEFARHARLMLAMAAVASGALWLRLLMAGVTAAQWPFETVYAIASWACWLVPLGITLVATRPERAPMLIARPTRAVE